MSTIGKSCLESWAGPGGSVTRARGLVTGALGLDGDPRDLPCAPPLCRLVMWAFRLRLYQNNLPHVGHSAAPLWASPWSAGSSPSSDCLATLLLLLVVEATASFPLLCPLLYLLKV